MGLGATFGKNKSDTTGSYNGVDNTASNTNFATTATNPQWVTDLAKNLGAGVTSLAGTNPQSYIAGPTPLLQTAANSAGDLNGTPWAYSQSHDAAKSVAGATAPSISAGMSQFLDPYLANVVGSTSADLAHSEGLTRAQDDLNLARSGAFGGSGAALTKAATEDALSRARATTIGGLESQGYNTALTGATSQAGVDQQQQALKLAAASQLANTADQYGATQRANIATQDAAAQPIQAIDQSRAQAPLDFQSILSQLFAGTLPQLFQGQTGTEAQTGTETQSGTNKGNTSGSGFGLGFK